MVICRVDGTCDQRPSCVRVLPVCLIAFPLWKKCADRGLIKVVFSLQGEQEIHRPVGPSSVRQPRRQKEECLAVFGYPLAFRILVHCKVNARLLSKDNGSSAFPLASHHGKPIGVTSLLLLKGLSAYRTEPIAARTSIKTRSPPTSTEHTTIAAALSVTPSGPPRPDRKSAGATTAPLY